MRDQAEPFLLEQIKKLEAERDELRDALISLLAATGHSDSTLSACAKASAVLAKYGIREALNKLTEESEKLGLYGVELTAETVSVPRDLLHCTLLLFRGALDCKDWVWSPDQWEAGDTWCKELQAMLAAAKEGK